MQVNMIHMESFYVTLAEYLLLLLFCALSTVIVLFGLLLLYRLNTLRNFNAAPSLIVYLCSLGVSCAALSFQYSLLILSLFNVFNNKGNRRNITGSSADTFPAWSSTQFIFWTGLVPGSLISATPICVFFLSMDRLLIILMPYTYNIKSWIKRGLAALSVLSVTALFCLSVGVNLAERPTTDHPECISFGCLTSHASRLVYAVNRFGVALPNFLAGTAFLAALFAFRGRLERLKNRATTISASKNGMLKNGANGLPLPHLNTKMALVNSESRKMSDRLTFYCVLFELLLDLLPNFINLILTAAFGFNVSVPLGAFRSMTYAACAFCSVLAHTSILWSIFKSKFRSIAANKTFHAKPLTFCRTAQNAGPFKNNDRSLINANQPNIFSNQRRNQQMQIGATPIGNRLCSA